jgi:hypothetical protein
MKKTTGLAMIAQERQEQLEIQGKYPVCDDGYTENQLIKVAISVLSGNCINYPTDWQYDWHKKTMAKTKTQQLAIAGALIAAEIDRLNKAEP